MKNSTMGLDFGTQSVRCGLFDELGNTIASGECKYDTTHPMQGWAEQNPQQWEKSMIEAVSMCLASTSEQQKKSILGISLCTTACTLVAVDNSGNPTMNAILWMDNRAKAQAKRVTDTKHPILRHCGGEASVEWLVPKTLWIKEQRPQIYESSAKFVEMQDYLTHLLTGVWCSSISQATCKSHYVEDKGGYDKSFFEDVGLSEFEDILNLDVRAQGEIAGGLTEQMAQRLGLKQGLPVYVGGVDAHVNMIGLGAINTGDMGIVMGTSFVHLATSENPVFADGIWGPYKSAIVPHSYCMEGGQVSAGSITKWFVNEFSIGGDNPYMTIANEAERISAGCDGVVCLDFFQGNRTPYKDPYATGTFFGLTLSHTRAHMYRAVLESVAFGTKNIIETMEKSGENISTIRGCGGVTNNPMWLQMISDISEKPIVLTKNSGMAGVLGSAIIAGVGAGVYTDFTSAAKGMVQPERTITPAKEAGYDKAYKKYINLYKQLKPIMRDDD